MNVCVCVRVQAITFKVFDIETSFWYGGRSGSYPGTA